jgi:hypothetical protein
MSVIPLTIFFSLLLAGTFVVLFAREQRRRHLTSPERDSLLPLADEIARTVGAPAGPGPGDGRCGCHKGARPACPDCLRRRDEQEPAYF